MDGTIQTANDINQTLYQFDFESLQQDHLQIFKDQMTCIHIQTSLPRRSRLGPTSIAFQLNEYFDGHNVKPS